MLNILNKNINLISFLFYFLIFTYVYIFSLNNIINLWTFNELHINYSAGFLPRGLIGTIMLKLDTLGFEKRIFFSSLFYIFTILNNIFLLGWCFMSFNSFREDYVNNTVMIDNETSKLIIFSSKIISIL